MREILMTILAAMMTLVTINNLFAFKTSASSVLENKPRYSHKNVSDGDIFTAWAEGKKGNGQGEWIKLDFGKKEQLHYLGLIPGYTKYNDKVGEVWFKNNRVKAATLEFSDGSSQNISFVDSQQIQYFKVSRNTSSVKVIIRDVYAGSTWSDTCISEIRPVFSVGETVDASLRINADQISEKEDEFFALVDIQAPFEQMKKREPVNLSIVVDRSGSMEGEKIRYAREAVKLVLGSLDENDILSIIGYDDTVKTYLYPQKVSGLDKNKVAVIIDSIMPNGGTNIYDGLDAGIKSVTRSQEIGNKRVLLLSDGLANQGVTDRRQIAALAKDAFLGHNVIVSTFGVGEEFDEDMMVGIADASLGKYHLISNPRQLFMQFHREISNITQAAVQNVSIDLEKNSSFLFEEVYGYDFTQTTSTISVKIGSMSVGEKKSILIRMKKSGTEKSISLKGTVAFRDEKQAMMRIKLTGDTMAVIKSTTVFDRDVQDKVLKVLAADSLEDTILEYEKGNGRKASDKLQQHITKLEKENRFLKSAVLAREITILKDILAGMNKTSSDTKFIKTVKERSYTIQKGEVE